MLMVGYFEKLPSERQIAWRCADSLSLQAFLGLPPGQNSPDDSSINRARLRIDVETHEAVFDWVLKRLVEHELLKGRVLGVDASTMAANAAMRSIVRRDTGQSFREFLTELARESGIETPTAADVAKFDRQRKGKKCSNREWLNPHDPDAKIAKMKDGTTHMAYKNEHAVDLETGAIVASVVHPADEGDTTTMWGTLEQASNSLQDVREDETVQADTSGLHMRDVTADKGYHSAQTLVNLEELELRGYISEPDRGRQRWATRSAAERPFKRAQQAAVYRNRRRRKGRRSKQLHRKRAELVERSFEHVLDDGGMRRVYLRGQENIAKRYLIHTAAFNLGLIMRKLTGFGTPRGWADARRAAARAAAQSVERLGALWKALRAYLRRQARRLADLGWSGAIRGLRRRAA
jgi:hypothetical protein